MGLGTFLLSASFFSITAAASEPPRLAVVNKADATVSVFNLATATLEFTQPVGFYPHEVSASLDGRQIFVSNYGKDHVRSTSANARPGSNVSVIDVRTGMLVRDLDLGIPACAPHGLANSFDGKRLYVTCEDRQEVAVVDLATGTLLHSVATAQAQSHAIVVTRDESRAYTANFSAGTVTVLDLKARSIVKQISTGPGTEGISLSSDDKTLYVTSVLGSTLSKIDTASLQITASVKTEKSPIRVAATPNGKYLLLNSSATGYLLVHDSATLRLVKKIKVGNQPIGLSVPNDDVAFVANMKDNTVSVIDLKLFEVSSVISTGARPDGLAFIPSH